MKALIGVIPLWDESRESIWMIPGYMDMIQQAGAIPIILPLNSTKDDVLELCGKLDGFILTGGHDVNPQIYNQPKSKKCGAPCTERDVLERIVFDYAVENDTPLLGICRGIQLINAFCGGTLYQDLPSEHPSEISHQMVAPYNRPWHSVNIIQDSPLHKLLQCTQLEVNSYHHQAIKTLAPNLSAMAVSKDDLVEAVYMPDKSYIWAVQWHPELNFKQSEPSQKIVKSFVDACNNLK